MNLRSLDLNLLVILDALLDEAHVTRAAARLALSQPATSSALERCRHVFDDPLLERAPGGRMRLTPRAQALREPLRVALAAVTDVVGQAPSDVSQLRQTVRVVMADLPATAIAAQLYARLHASAPGIQVIVLPWRSENEAMAALDSGAADIAVCVAGDAGPDLRSTVVLREDYKVALRQGHPAAEKIDVDSWLAWPHVLVSSRGQSASTLDRMLAAQGRQRTVGFVLPAFAMVPPLLLATDLIALLPGRCLAGELSRGLAVFDPPLPVAGFDLSMTWHARRERDPGVRHVGAVLATLIGAL